MSADEPHAMVDIDSALDAARSMVVDGLDMSEPYTDAIDVFESAFRAALDNSTPTLESVLASRGESVEEVRQWWGGW
ncbi:hypothetical protein [Nocardia puris]|uniref:Uncharacterized protein n=1 Tax=Nocardia puris TaxID=208602 RepID=A0A366DPC7_9NOCA|nr:hypothetical protein [Nocardia puris]RBO91309.1 hypothetical protein DFR74_10411 [Nocardia puris]